MMTTTASVHPLRHYQPSIALPFLPVVAVLGSGLNLVVYLPLLGIAITS
jgi:hypothetical protein